MRFDFKIHKWANFYFFIQNLSEWHFSNRKVYNIFWRKKLEVFSEEEESALKKFKKIRLRYPQSKTCFEKAFLLSEHPFQDLSKKLTKKELKTIKDIFYIFENKFEYLYKKELPLLKKWQEKLNKTANDKKLVNKIVNSLNILYKTSVKDKAVDVYLLFSTSSSLGGGANIDSKSISLEVSSYPLKNSRHVLGIIWHETIHLIFQNHYFHPLLRKYFLNKEEKFQLIKEIVTESLFPYGILGLELLKNQSNKPLRGTNPKQTKQILQLTRDYLDQRKYFSREYIKKIDSGIIDILCPQIRYTNLN